MGLRGEKCKIIYIIIVFLSIHLKFSFNLGIVPDMKICCPLPLSKPPLYDLDIDFKVLILNVKNECFGYLDE